MTTSVGKRLRYARNCSRFTLKLVSKYVKVPVARMQRWEGGAGIPAEWVYYLAELYNAPLAWVLNGGEPPMQPPAKPASYAAEMLERCFGRPGPKPEAVLNERWRRARFKATP